MIYKFKQEVGAIVVQDVRDFKARSKIEEIIG